MTANIHAQKSEASSIRTTAPAPSVTEPSPELFTSTSRCPDCGQYIQTVDVLEAVCSECQVDIGAPVSRNGRAWYTNAERRKRKQTARRVSPLFTDKGIGTHGNLKDRAWTKDRTSSDYRLGYALGELKRMGSKFEVPEQILESAALLYRKAQREGLIEGRCIDGFTAASLLIAIRQSPVRMPISCKEIRDVYRAERRQFENARTVLELELNQKVPPMDPVDFIPKATSELGSPLVIRQSARKLLEAQEEGEEFLGNSPRTLAAAAVYAAYDIVECDDSVTLAEVSDVLGVASSAISTNKSDVMKYRHVVE